ncbi:NAD-glutamate dehydrogenase [Cobetia sp. UIB-001]|uniref:NAD-glutamate dehydrogenase n=1 Tax=Cobetia sp. UIB-001 TaxID=2717697 RepID=UPI00384BC116
MLHVATDGKQEFLAQLEEQLDKRLPKDKVDVIAAFARDYHATASFEDMAERKLDDLYGSTLAVWHFLQSLEAPKVRAYNPDFEKHGWQSTHTIIEVLHPDMPFLVDSVRIELNRRGITVHAIHNAVLAVARDDAGQLERVTAPRAENAPQHRESLIYIEVDRHNDAETLEDLETSLREVLAEVRVAVADFDAMRSQGAQALQELRDNRPPTVSEADHQEACDFMQWMGNDHFTFLGYDEYTVDEQEDGTRVLNKVEGSELGVLKLDLERYHEQSRHQQSVNSDQYVLIPELLSFAKSAFHARVHRPAYPDYITVERFDEEGRVIGERRFLGLYTSTVYNQSPRNVPILRRKVQDVMEAAGVNPKGHNGKHLLQILEVYPRDDLFQISTDELTRTATSILNIRERRRVRLIVREDRFGKFFSVLVFVPRDVYSTDLRVRIQNLLCEELNATFGDFTPYLSESVLTRIQFILRFKGDEPGQYDMRALENKIAQLARSWRDELHAAMVEGFGEEQANELMTRYRDAFPGSYRDDFSPRTAVYDVGHLRALDEGQAVGLSTYRLVEDDNSGVNLKLFHKHQPIPLSDVLPVLENLGLRVIGERPYEITRTDSSCWVHDFDLEHHGKGAVELSEVRESFIEAFKKIWSGEAESDAFNRLIIGSGLDWREVAMLRAYARYLKQIRFGLSQAYIANALGSHPDITRELVQLFNLRFDPQGQGGEDDVNACRERINGLLDQVSSLNDDRLLRRYVDLMMATLRTNFFQPAEDGQAKDYISFKLDTRSIPDVPKPRPMFEIFVYSPRVEGVHLRGGKVARGGLRWSDRHEDFRTEVLGLVKAQQVKNAVIVPVGAKGGFVCKRMPETTDRDVIQKEGIACYQIFIRALLDITDNLSGGDVVAPTAVVRYDEDDPYMVVAADKGTATFSDIANAISNEYGFWLGDAFASGGANGYDHKGMGITAKGAWVSVQRHFREMGINIQEDEFSVVGIGDMAGDVFGNGMLLSEKIRLVGAFNHRNIFVDPNPDTAKSFAERERLFRLPRSSWDDYDKSLISEGGGLFSRDAKTIAISPQMKEVFDISADHLAPNELINAMLKAQVDLIWNGGIGTYVKASSESHADVGDKANDGLRIDGRELRCKVVGEGGNLGLTQRGRMEAAAQQGVRVNTDFIDNAGGVNCSDHEVNIKILLDDIVARGDLTDKQRNQQLAEMTDEVGELVIKDNYRQTQALSLSEQQSKEGMGVFRRFINELEAAGTLDRELEFLPSDEALIERSNAGEALTLPELSVLVSYAKSDLKTSLIASDVPDDSYVQQHLERAFPRVLMERFPEEMYQHRLKREIAATQIANDLVDHMGIAFVRRLEDTTGADKAEIARAYIVARDSFNLEALWTQIEALDHQVPAELQYRMMSDLMRLMRRATRWFLRQRSSMGVKECIGHFAPRLAQLSESIGERLKGEARENWEARRDSYVEAGVPEALASTIAATSSLYAGLGIIEAAKATGEKINRVAEAFYGIGHRLELPWVGDKINGLEVQDSWQAQARESFRDDLDRQQLALTVSVLKQDNAPREIDERVDSWMASHESLVSRWCSLLGEMKGGAQLSFPLFAVALRELVDLAESKREA